VKVRDQEVEMARQLIENLTAEWSPDEFTDEYREALLKIVEAKINGEEIEVVEAEPTAKVVDLMEALKASVAAAKGQADDEPAAKPASKKSSAKKSSAKKSSAKKSSAKKATAKKAPARKKAVGE
jgi:DNA end-binding protein Ku